MRNKFVNSYSKKSMLWDSMNSWKSFSVSCWLQKHFPCKKKLSICLKKRQEVRWIWQRQTFIAQFSQLWSTGKHWLCNLQSGIVVEKNWSLPIDQCQLQALWFFLHLINLLNLFLRHNGFARIQKAIWIRWTVDYQTVTIMFFWWKFGFGKCFVASSGPSHWDGHH